MDSEFIPVEWFKVGASLAYTDARFTKNVVEEFGNTLYFGPYADTPAWTGNVFAEVTLPMPDDLGKVTLRGDTYAQSKFYFSSLNATVNPGTEIPDYNITNFRLNWANIAQAHLDAGLFVTNAFDKVYYTGGLPIGSVFGINTAVPGRTRMHGIELRYSF